MYNKKWYYNFKLHVHDEEFLGKSCTFIYILTCIDHVDKQTKTYVHVKCTRKSDPNFFLEYINFKVPISLRPLSLFKVHCTFSTKCILKHIFLQCSLEMLFVSSVIILFYFTLNLKKLYGQLGLI